MLCGGSRASVHLWDHRHPPTLGLGLGIYGAEVFQQSSFLPRSSSAKLLQRVKSSSRSHCKSPGQIPVPHDCFRVFFCSPSLNLAVVLLVYVFFPKSKLKSDGLIVKISDELSLNFTGNYVYSWVLGAPMDETRDRFVLKCSLLCSTQIYKIGGFAKVSVYFFFQSQGEDDPELPVEELSPVAGGIVALGKFDALHIGHRQLAIQAARVGTPYLLSFVGMAEVLGWKPRAPIVAKCDRQRVLSSWASCCGNVAPVEFEIEFASVRHLNPQQFVEKLSRELRVCGVVAGENYRFGYRASGNASELVRLCEEYGISAYIINSVMDKNQVCGIAETEEDSKSKERGQVSSTRVRHALAAGDVRYVTELLGRPHRLISKVRTQDITSKGGMISLQTSSLVNLPPGNGVYKACSLIVGDAHPISCKVVVDTWSLHIETEEVEEVRFRNSDGSHEFLLLGIEFS